MAAEAVTVKIVDDDGEPAPGASSTLLPLRSPPKRTPAQIQRMFQAGDGAALEWAMNRLAGHTTPHPPFAGCCLPRHSPICRHPHAQSASDRVTVQLMPDLDFYAPDAEVVRHFHTLIKSRKSPFKTFYIGACVRHPVDRFFRDTRMPHNEHRTILLSC